METQEILNQILQDIQEIKEALIKCGSISVSTVNTKDESNG